MRKSTILLLPVLALGLLHCVGDDPTTATNTPPDGGDGTDSGNTTTTDSGGSTDAGTDTGADVNVDAGPPAPVGKIDWATTFGTDGGAIRVATDASGVVYVAATFNGTVSFGGTMLTSAGTDIAVVKLTSTGAVTWAKKIGSSGSDYLGSISVDGAGVYVSGTFDATPITALPSASATGSAGVTSGFVAKFSATNGDASWIRSFVPTGSGATAPIVNVKARNGRVGFTCEFKGTLGTDTSANNAVLTGTLDPSNGSTSVSQLLRATNDDAVVHGYSFEMDKDGGLFIGGATYASTISTRTALIAGSALNGSRTGYVIKLTPAGAASWVHIFGSSTTPTPGGAGAGAAALTMALDDATNVYVGGDFAFCDFGKGDVTANGGGSQDDGFVVKLNSNMGGTTVWARALGGSGAEALYGLAVDPWGQPIAGGYSTNGGSIDGKAFANGQGIFLVKLSPFDGSAQYVNGRSSTDIVSIGGVATQPNGYAVMVGGFSAGLELTTSVTPTTATDVFVAGFTP